MNFLKTLIIVAVPLVFIWGCETPGENKSSLADKAAMQAQSKVAMQAQSAAKRAAAAANAAAAAANAPIATDPPDISMKWVYYSFSVDS